MRNEAPAKPTPLQRGGLTPSPFPLPRDLPAPGLDAGPTIGRMPELWEGREHEGEEFEDDYTDLVMRGCRFERCSFAGAGLDELSTSGCTFSECRFDHASLNASTHERSSFVTCRFDTASLFGARFTDCRLTGSAFPKARLDALAIERGDWSLVELRGQDLRGRDLRDLRLYEADLTASDLRECDLRGADLRRARVKGVQLKGSDLRGAQLDGARLHELDLGGVRLDVAGAIAIALAHGAQVE
jgi:fluoroquinolone resistance protein